MSELCTLEGNDVTKIVKESKGVSKFKIRF